MVDAPALGAGSLGSGGSSPLPGTVKQKHHNQRLWCFCIVELGRTYRCLNKRENSIGTKDDYKTDDAPEHVLLACLALRFVIRVCDEIEYTPYKNHKGAEREQRDDRRQYRVLNLYEKSLIRHAFIIAETRTEARVSALLPEGKLVDLDARRNVSYWRRGVRKLERTTEDVHETPYRYHDEEPDDAPEHEGLALLTLLLIMPTSNEVLEYSPDEHNESDRKYERDEYGVDKRNDSCSNRTDVCSYNLCGSEHWESQSSENITEFLHR